MGALRLQFNKDNNVKTFKLNRTSKDRDLADDISMYVQEHGGSFVIQRHSVDFNVPDECGLFMLMKYPMLIEEKYI